MSDPLAIYIRFDDGFLPYARACLNSLRLNYPAHPTIIVDSSLRRENRRIE